MNTQKRGVSTHLAVAQRLVEAGYEVLQPFDTSLPYDLVVITGSSNGWFLSSTMVAMRIQCKTAHLEDDGGVIVFNGYINGGRLEEGRRKRKGYWGEADWFGVHSPDTGKVYLIPVQAFPDGAEIRLRIKKTKNNQEKGITWAKDYEI